MGLNETPAGERARIVFFGVRNAGKSSLANAVLGQSAAVVSDVPGTTTDAVRKAMELLPAGPVLVVDTPGIDDAGDLGDLRTERTRAALDEADVAVLVVDGMRGPTAWDDELARAFRRRGIPFLVAVSKADAAAGAADAAVEGAAGVCAVSAHTGEGIGELKEALAALAARAVRERPLVADLLGPGDVAVLVIPLDSAAPKGRLILPQQQVIRDALAAGACPCATSVEQLPALLAHLDGPPRLVVTDSQVFGAVAAVVPAEVPLTSFSVLMARYKGDLPAQVRAVEALGRLGDADTVLIAEGCTHHRQCDDIGTVKLPAWIRQISGANPSFAFTAGRDFPADLSPYAVVVHCGGCMLNGREMQSRLQRACGQGVPMTNYGMAIARAHGILDRALAPLTRDVAEAADIVPPHN